MKTNPVFFDTPDQYQIARKAQKLEGKRISLGNGAGNFAGDYTLTADGRLFRYEADERGTIYAIECRPSHFAAVIVWATASIKKH